jgi:replicative DNA helicase
MQVLVDLAAERAVLGGIYTYGEDAFVDVSDIIQQPTVFSDSSNQALYKIFQFLIEKRELKQLDQSSIMSAANELGFSYLFERPDELSHVKSIMHSQVRLENVRFWAAQIRKLQVARLLRDQLSSAIVSIEQLTGKESVDAIVGIAENAVFDFGELLNADNKNNEPVRVGDGVREYYRHLAANPVEQVGISSGFKYLDRYIGGGFRRKTVSLLGARTGIGKSMISDNVALHVARELKIPVLYLDTEMTTEDHWHRVGANLSGVAIDKLETGKFGRSKNDLQGVKHAIEVMEDIPLYYLNVSGKPFEETISIMRRWIKQSVGFDEKGKVKDCLIIYDYIKMMSSESITAALQEYQVLGFMMTALHNFSVKHDVPIFSLVQLNRDGIDKETTDVVSGSDRVTWLATNLTVFKPKSDDEIAADGGLINGTHKLVTIKSRHGGGTPHGDWLNLIMTGELGRIEEGETHINLRRKRDDKMRTPKDVPPELENYDDSDVPFDTTVAVVNETPVRTEGSYDLVPIK